MEAAVAERGLVLFEDQTLRDGLQNESRLLTLEEKLEIARLLVAVGVRRLQVGSFVNPRRVPQMRQTDELASLVLGKLPNLLCTALVLNGRGLERAIRCGLRHLSLSVSLSDGHSHRNAGCAAGEALERMVVLVRQATGQGIAVRAGLQCAFGGGEGDPVPWRRVVAAAGQLAAAGAREINLADTAGVASADDIVHLVTRVREAIPAAEMSLHLHGQRGRGLVNLEAGYRAGVHLFDVTLGGLGGCPFLSGAVGNIALEAAVALFARIGVATGIDPVALTTVVRRCMELLGRRGQAAHGRPPQRAG